MSNRRKPKTPDRNTRIGLTVLQLFELIPDDTTTEQWFENSLWGVTGRYCGHCGATDTVVKPSGRPMKYRCRCCDQFFNVKTRTRLQGTRVSLRKWVYCIYLMLTSLKGISSMKLHRELDVTQRTSWYMAHRVRMAMNFAEKLVGNEPMDGTVQVDEMYIGGKERNKHTSKKLRLGRGAVGKQAVVGIRHTASGMIRAIPMDRVNQKNINKYLKKNAKPGTEVHTDESRVYEKIEDEGFVHKSVNHSDGVYVKNGVTTSAIESCWALFKRGLYGTFHHVDKKHLHRYVNEIEGRLNIRSMNTLVQIALVMGCMGNTHLPYKELVADTETE